MKTTDTVSTEVRETVTIGGKVFYKVVRQDIRINKPPNPTKRQVKASSKIKRTPQRGQSLSMLPFSTSTYVLSRPNGPKPLAHGNSNTTAPTTTSKTYDMDTFGIERTAAHIER